MKKIIYFLTITTLFLSTSCSNEDLTTNELLTESQVLKFDSYKEMQNKIVEIKKISDAKESRILNIINSKNLKSNNLEFYHTERLNSIYELRKELNFTSIQSIADEINSLKLLNPKKANLLYDKYSTLLKKDKYSITYLNDNETALVLNSKGEVIIGGKIIKLINTSNTESTRYIGVDFVREGTLLTNGSYSISWHAGRSEHKDDLGRTFWRNFTQLGSNVLTNNGWVQYPSSMRPLLDAHANFSYGGAHTEHLGFLSSYGSVLRNSGGQKNVPNIPYYVKTGGTFTTTVNGVEMKLEGQSIFTIGYGL
ncbi:hypothetical protein C3B47_14085 [Flavobacterium columnare]|uniref:Lipoprotein n=1 Tax=Flavobacterium columnare (strain ATCC 49512 / CIP 103533 / TG 44/87) TaxID=1041826 RepID=G8XA74_FLACA|nr:hypothetical protein [Flavobacterium columnare]AEW85932.1 hypothetical protein FCOL_05535 [Flavobacterium columnare ATCC 49512]MBF6653984.1 hypothetical protein [Flavobacterium columnare]MBF6656637.1 hypothetical protein [Flavobacterium columnare]